MEVVNSGCLASPISTTGERVRIFHMLRDTTVRGRGRHMGQLDGKVAIVTRGSRGRLIPFGRLRVSAATRCAQCTALGQRELRAGRGVGRWLLDCGGGVLGSWHAEPLDVASPRSPRPTVRRTRVPSRRSR
jgi:hypothetical protein